MCVGARKENLSAQSARRAIRLVVGAQPLPRVKEKGAYRPCEAVLWCTRLILHVLRMYGDFQVSEGELLLRLLEREGGERTRMLRPGRLFFFEPHALKGREAWPLHPFWFLFVRKNTQGQDAPE